MNKLIITTAVAAMLATSAFATDLPNKKKAPTPTPTPVAAAVAPASVDSLTAQYGQDLGTNFGAKVDDAYTLTYKHSLGAGFSVGGMAQTTQVSGSNLKQNLEAQAGYALPAMASITVSGKAGIGERFVDTGNFPYYALYGNADYAVGHGIILNAVGYRFRSAVDNATYSYQSHQLSTGVTYDINPTYSVSAKIARSFDSAYVATGDSITGALTVKF